MGIQNTVKDIDKKTWNEAIDFIISTCEISGYKLVKSCECESPKADYKEAEERGKTYYEHHVKKPIQLEFVKCLNFQKSTIIPFVVKKEGLVFVVEGFSNVNPTYFAQTSIIKKEAIKNVRRKITKHGEFKGRLMHMLASKPEYENTLAQYRDEIKTPVIECGIISCFVHDTVLNNFQHLF